MSNSKVPDTIFTAPTNNQELFTRYSALIAKTVKQYDRVGRYTEDIFQDVCMRLLAANFLDTFSQAHRPKLPSIITGIEAAQMLGITWPQWVTSQQNREKICSNVKALGFNPNAWAPCPINFSPKGKIVSGAKKKDLFYTEEVLETKGKWHKLHYAPIYPKASSEILTKSKFENYLKMAVRNYVKNYFRTLGRHDQDLYLEPNEDGSAWEAGLADNQTEGREELVDFTRACKSLGPQGIPLLKLLDRVNMKTDDNSAFANALQKLNIPVELFVQAQLE